MSITYNYEGALAKQGYSRSVKSGYNLGLASARRFSAQQQLAYDQMAQRSQLESQRLGNQRWLQQASEAGSMRRIQAQGNINESLRANAAGDRSTLLGEQFKYRGDEMVKRAGISDSSQKTYFELRSDYDDRVSSMKLNAEGAAQKADIDRKRSTLKDAMDKGYVSPEEYRIYDAEILRNAAGVNWFSKEEKPGDTGTFYTDPATGERVFMGKDGGIERLGPSKSKYDEEVADGRIVEIRGGEGSPFAGEVTTIITTDSRGARKVQQVVGPKQLAHKAKLERAVLMKSWSTDAINMMKAEMEQVNMINQYNDMNQDSKIPVPKMKSFEEQFKIQKDMYETGDIGVRRDTEGGGQGGGGDTVPGSGVARPTTPEDFGNLNPGDRFIDPRSGEIREWQGEGGGGQGGGSNDSSPPPPGSPELWADQEGDITTPTTPAGLDAVPPGGGLTDQRGGSEQSSVGQSPATQGGSDSPEWRISHVGSNGIAVDNFGTQWPGTAADAAKIKARAPYIDPRSNKLVIRTGMGDVITVSRDQLANGYLGDYKKQHPNQAAPPFSIFQTRADSIMRAYNRQ